VEAFDWCELARPIKEKQRNVKRKNGKRVLGQIIFGQCSMRYIYSSIVRPAISWFAPGKFELPERWRLVPIFPVAAFCGVEISGGAEIRTPQQRKGV
jgi:hypothetical protein